MIKEFLSVLLSGALVGVLMFCAYYVGREEALTDACSVCLERGVK